MYQQIIVRHLDKPRRKDIEQDIEWVCDSLGFRSGRDIEDIAVQIVEDVVRRFAERHRVSSDMIADDLSISQARVNHHLRNLIDTGFLYRERRQIHLRGGSLKSAVEEMRKDANRIFDELADIAEEVDEKVGLKNRE